MKIKEILFEGVAGPKNCWPGHRKVGTQPGTGKNAGQRVNDCEKIKKEGVAEGQGSIVDKCASLAAKYFNSAGLQQQYDIDEFIKINTGDNVVVDKCASLAAKYFNSAGLQQQYDIGEYIKANVKQGVAEDLDELQQEFDMIESIIESIADQHAVDAELVWEDLSTLTDDELYVFAVTQPVMEDWQKANKKDKTDGMSQKAVNAYRRENPGSKLKTAVTTKPSKLKRGSKASKRRSSYCSRSAGQKKMHSIDCSKTPDKAICKARRRWNC